MMRFLVRNRTNKQRSTHYNKWIDKQRIDNGYIYICIFIYGRQQMALLFDYTFFEPHNFEKPKKTHKEKKGKEKREEFINSS